MPNNWLLTAILPANA